MFCGDAVEPHEGGFDPPDDFLLFLERGQGQLKGCELLRIDVRLTYARPFSRASNSRDRRDYSGNRSEKPASWPASIGHG